AMISRPIAIAGVVVFVLFAGVVAYRLLFRVETLEEAALKCMDALERGDAASLLRYVTEEEKQVTGLDESKLDAFLRRFYQPRMEGFKATGDEADLLDYTQRLYLDRTYVHPDGRVVVVSVAVTATDNGPKLERLITDILFSGLAADWPRDPKQRPPAVPGMVASYEPMKDALTVLEALPLQGFGILDEVAGTMRLCRWREELGSMERAKALVAQSQSGP
ncbi:MAG: hypothetical protein C4341_08390, partial [Armatimonadota bacterium]